MANTEFSSAEIIKYLFTNGAMGARPTQWHVALHTGAPGINGTDNEVTVGLDPSYLRRPANFVTSVVSGITSAKNTAEIAFPASTAAAPYQALYASVFNASTGGTCLGILALDPARTIAVAGVLRFPVNELIIEGFSYGN
jgi:hypothetical protein